MPIKKIAVTVVLVLWASLFLLSNLEHQRLLSDLQEISDKSISSVYVYRQETEEWVSLEAHAFLIGALFSAAASDLTIYGGRPVFVEPSTLVRIRADEKCYHLELSGEKNAAFKMYMAVTRAGCSENSNFFVSPDPKGFYSLNLKAFRELLQQLRDQS